MNKVKNILRKIGKVLDLISYFVPDVFLGLSIFIALTNKLGDYNFLFSILLFITYLATSYGEVMYHRVRFVEDMAGKIVDEHINSIITSHINDFAKDVDSKNFVTLDGFIDSIGILDQHFENRLSEVKEEILEEAKRGDDNKVD